MADKSKYTNPHEYSGQVDISGPLTTSGTGTHTGHQTMAQVTTSGAGAHSGTNTFTGAVNLDGKVHYAHETKTVGALSLGTTISFLSVTDTKAYSLIDGTAEGEVKIVICSAVSGSPVGTLTPNATAGAYATIAFSVVGQSATLVWTGSGWAIVGRQSGATANATSVAGLPVIA
jgi:hypothetical protein